MVIMARIYCSVNVTDSENGYNLIFNHGSDRSEGKDTTLNRRKPYASCQFVRVVNMQKIEECK